MNNSKGFNNSKSFNAVQSAVGPEISSSGSSTDNLDHTPGIPTDKFKNGSDSEEVGTQSLIR